ncbi:MAG: glycosyltransferase family 2 protein [Lachnospiraceae bacterium]|nr:glycosyltransferase family 2 protein [Lachnospiraceae bacterium]
MREELISIIIPMCNSSKFIEDCIKSVINQTYSHFEILLIDDGSTDATVSVCQAFQKQDSRISIYTQKHQGVSAARNLGIEKSNGKYITFIDSDDFVDACLLEKYIKAISFFEETHQPFAWIMCGMQIDAFSGTMQNESKLVDDSAEFVCLARHQVAYLSWLKLFNFITNKLYNAEMIRNQQIRFQLQIQIGEDLQFNLDYLNKVEGDLCMVNLPLYHYVRRSNDSLSLVYYPGAVQHTKKVYTELIVFAYKQADITEDDLHVLNAIYLMDWTSRITALYEARNTNLSEEERYKSVHREIASSEFQTLLKDSFRHGKISLLRYITLKMESFRLYYQLRRIYRWMRRA